MNNIIDDKVKNIIKHTYTAYLIKDYWCINNCLI